MFQEWVTSFSCPSFSCFWTLMSSLLACLPLVSGSLRPLVWSHLQQRTWCDDRALLMLCMALTDMQNTADEQQTPDSSLLASSAGLVAAAVSLAAASCEESPLPCPACAGPVSASCCPFALDIKSAAILAAACCAPSALSDAALAGALSPSRCLLDTSAICCVAPALLGPGSAGMLLTSCCLLGSVSILGAASCPASASLCPASAGGRSACCCPWVLPAPCGPMSAARPACGGAAGDSAVSAAVPASLGSRSGLPGPPLAASCDD